MTTNEQPISAAETPRAGTAQARCLVVLNPHSRSGDKNRDTLQQVLQDNGFELMGGRAFDVSRLPDLLREYGTQLVPATDRILVGGGDGTVNRLLHVLIDAPVPVALAPLGTANDLARTLGVPEDLDAAAKIARHGVALRIDLGRVNDQLFANVANMGLGLKVTERLTKTLKERFGAFGYLRALLSAYRDTRPFRCRVSVDGEAEHRIRAIHVAVGNGRHYGGGATVEQDAAIDDNRLDLYALSPMPLWRLLLAGPWLKLGRHREIEEVKTLRGTRISVRTSRRLAISADGEVVTWTPAAFEVVSGALSVMVPRDQPGAGIRQHSEDAA